jgi:large subunit ribosomal protein L6
MSRIGKKFIMVPKQVKVNLNGQKISIDGPKGTLSRILPSPLCCTFNGQQGKLFIQKTQDTKISKPLHGLMRTLVANMVTGVSEGFYKRLQIVGVGYRAQIDGKNIVLNMGYSHLVRILIPNSLSVTCETPTTVVISGIEKDAVGEFASKIRSVRPPEPYKGKGIMYENEVIHRKAGKTGR